MALGTVDIPRRENEVHGDRQCRRGTIQATSGANYTTGGEAVTADRLRMNTLESVYVFSPAAGNRLVTVDPATNKLKVFTAIGTEATASSDQSAVVVPFIAYGY